MRGDVQIQRLTPDEWPRALELRVRALTESPAAFLSTLERESTLSEEQWRARLGGNRWVAATTGGRDLGLAAGITKHDGVHELVGMWVDPEARGTGVATALIADLSAWAANAGANALTLCVVSENLPAILAYEKNGFERSATQGDDALLTMIKRL